MFKKISKLFILLVLFAFPRSAHATNTLIIPVRELPLNQEQNTLDLPRQINAISSPATTPITWLIDYTVLSSATSSAFFKSIAGPFTEIGLILDVPPTLYQNSPVEQPLHPATSYLLNSYRPKDREILIDQLMLHFFNRLDFYPRTVASAYIDSYSLNYLQQEYSVTGALFNLPGLTGLRPEITGGFLFPYFPSKQNALVPAGNPNEKIPIMVTTWDQNLTNETLLPSAFAVLNSYLLANDHSTYSQESARFLLLNPLTTPTAQTDTVFASPEYQYTKTETDLTSLVFFNHHETESFYFDRNINPFLRLTTYPLISSPFSLDNLNQLPPHPQYKLLDKDTLTFKSNPFWSPYLTPPLKMLLDLLKVLIILYLIAHLFIPKKFFTELKSHPAILVIILFGSFVWSLTTLKSGSLSLYGLNFYGAHSHDAPFHLALIESFKNSLWPLNNPNLSGTLLKNYHFFYDYLLALVSKLLNIEAIDLYFRYLPPIISVSIGLLAFNLLKRWQYSTVGISASLFFLYFTGSLGFIPYFFREGQLFGGESIFWMQQNLTTLINPPFAFSLVLLLLILNLLEEWKTISLKRLIIIALLGGLLIEIKAYAFVLLLSGMFLTSLSYLPTHRARVKHFIPLILSIGAAGIIFFLPSYSPGNSLFIFKPFWFINSLLASQDRLNWLQGANAWQAYIANGAWPKLFLLQILATLLFYGGNLGIRLFALPSWWRNFNGSLTQRLSSFIILFGLAIPFFFIQSGNSWNSIQFAYYSLFFLSLLLGPVVVNYLSSLHTLPQLLLALLILILFAMPTTIGSLNQYLTKKPQTSITHEELRALDFLSQVEGRNVITPIFNRHFRHPFIVPVPLSAAESTAYVPALTGKQAYFADEVNLIIMDYDYKLEKQLNQKFYNTPDPEFIKTLLIENNLDYVYTLPGHYLNENALKYLKLLYDTGNYQIYTLK